MQVPFVNQVFDKDDAKGSSLRLSEFLFPDALQVEERLEVKPLTQGTTNGLYKVTYRPVDAGDASAHDAVLVKVYGDGTDITIDRNKELKVHQLLAENKLSSSPLVRFANGHAYQFIHGRTCSVSDMANPVIYRGVARELARWHATLPIVEPKDPQKGLEHEPSVWATAKKWLDAIPSQPKRSKADKALLREQFHYVTGKLLLNDDKPEPLVLGHGDLLCGNIIVQDLTEPTEAASVRFIDYEHATYCPRAFELANHFAEWTGFECDYSLLPTRLTRRDFIHEYLAEIARLQQDGDHADIPGLCALIQAETSTGAIDFDYAGYAEKRLAEYWDWRRVHDGNVDADEGISQREERWAAP
ncbi:uncharacterized protein NECHADRAFT_37289 [Fusarium vanettenii 77-13-4]|uniref:ethanolamine kinase n=1 Tax=Fusarium vanettenii (strain ATCC MYA-4622 / CBS 123669 / FGSC 9596 / NRRL 45880 / 77-13-4) TaxID=660122 RepID=C7ZFH4_FUSV7|nr:uncharacterized protein NECHADRAFT_37289 [Fusarium vanettenii 77-13-4]EEU37151.1 hypothetical protein NECHADRAFT_37289 [Fusarium vanettenii 77-13-4]